MGELVGFAHAATVAAEVAMAKGDLVTAETRLIEAAVFCRGAAERGENYLLASQERGLSEARLIVAQINERN